MSKDIVGYQVIPKDKTEAARKRLRSILSIVWPGIKAIYEGRKLEEERQKIIERINDLLPQASYKPEEAEEIIKQLYNSEIAPFVCIPGALNILVQVADKSSTNIGDEIMKILVIERAKQIQYRKRLSQKNIAYMAM